METQKYNKNFLSNVIFRIDYSPILNLEENKPISFQEEIKNDFPILEPLSMQGIHFEYKGDPEKEVETKNFKKITWKFFNKEKDVTITLDSNHLAVSFIKEKYDDYSGFKEKIEEILTIFFKHYPSTIINRLGLRYVNEIKLDEDNYHDWGKYINNKLTNNINLFQNKEKVRRVLSSIILMLDDENSLLNFQFGIFNSVFPSKLTNKTFILDYDCHTKETAENKEDILTKLDYFNNYISEMFERSIKNELRKIMKS